MVGVGKREGVMDGESGELTVRKCGRPIGA